MSQSNLYYCFHNPNTEEATLNFIIKIFVEAGIPILEQAIARQENSPQRPSGDQLINGTPDPQIDP